jgi:RimJ/RimL family protein N-acetyltransferase
MSEHTELSTTRLLLRRWQAADREPFAALNADPEVMANFPDLLTREQSDGLVERIEADFERHDFGLWALETRAGGEFIGFTGLAAVPYETHFTPAVEIGWRLARGAWGQGYASEAALASLAFGFDEVGLDEIVSFATVGNARSRAVMERIGMERDPDGDFDHPRLPVGHPLALHVLYRIAPAGN